VKTRLPEVRALNQNTFFSVQEITEAYGVDSFVSVIYGDSKSYRDLLGVACVVANDDFVLLIVSLKEDVIKTENLTCEEFENVSLMTDYGFERKSRVAFICE
jgi:hypothetical protein